MVGTVNVAAAPSGDAPSGVDYSEYRVKTGTVQGDWVRTANTGGASPFASQVTISAEGQHTVEYRSVDKAGNAEAAKTVSFGIDIPDAGFPVIEAFADPTSGAAPLLVRFSATGFDPDGGALNYKWEFDDGAVFGRAAERTYAKAGTYTVTVTATDDEGNTTSKTVTVTVTKPGGQAPTVTGTASVTSGPATLPVAFTAEGNDPDGPDERPVLRVGLRGRRHLVRPEPDAHLHDAGHLHREGDGDRRRRRDGDQDVHHHREQPGRQSRPDRPGPVLPGQRGHDAPRR